jgi:hypothetical protein
MTIVSRPALGQQCLTPSAFGSGNLSMTGGVGQPCVGRTPAYWSQSLSFADWAAAGSLAVTTNGKSPTLFQDIFQPVSQWFTNKTLLWVLGQGDAPPYDVAKYCAAAFLNAKRGWTVAPNVEAVKGIWKEFSTSGYYTPMAGAKPWDHAMICTYLKSTMPL